MKTPTLPEFAIEAGLEIGKSEDGTMWVLTTKGERTLWARHVAAFEWKDQGTINDICVAYHCGQCDT